MESIHKRIIFIIVLIVVFSNIPPIHYFLKENYHYQNLDGSFEFVEQAGSTQGFDILVKRFEEFKKEYPKSPHRKLYRTFNIKVWQFWNWLHIFSMFKRYSLPYLKTLP